MPEIRIGIIGSGGMATRRAENFAAHPDTTVAVIAARNRATGSELADKVGATCVSDWKDLLSTDLDAVFVGTHNELHGPITIAALDAGKHVFTEYPTTRTAAEGLLIANRIADSASPVLRVSNNEYVSAEHAALKSSIAECGDLFTSHFLRLTPGRGRRPEVLFNLNLTGPPALFFAYHVHTYVSLFGPAQWVHCSARYEGLRPDTGYDRFMNTLTVGFADGGNGQWTWAGGIAVESAVQEARVVMSEGTWMETETGWDLSTTSGTSSLEFGDNVGSLEDLFVADIKGETDWRGDVHVALSTAAIGHAAEISARESRVVTIDELPKC